MGRSTVLLLTAIPLSFVAGSAATWVSMKDRFGKEPVAIVEDRPIAEGDRPLVGDGLDWRAMANKAWKATLDDPDFQVVEWRQASVDRRNGQVTVVARLRSKTRAGGMANRVHFVTMRADGRELVSYEDAAALQFENQTRYEPDEYLILYDIEPRK